MLRNFEKLFATKANAAGTVVHIGAGICSELPEYERLKFEKIQLVEAHSGLAEQLAKKVKNVDHVNVSNVVVAAKEGAVPFIRTNNPRFDSLKKPAAIKEFFPNLSVVNDAIVNAVSLDALLKTFALDSAKENVLVLELQGAETDILGSVIPANLQLFSWLIIKTSDVAVYDNKADNADLCSVAKKFGFEPIYTEELTFPFCVKTYKRNDAEIALYKTKQKADQLEIELNKVNTAYVGVKSELETSQSDLVAVKLELEKSQMNCVATKSELETSQSKLVSVKSELETGQSDLAAVKLELDKSQMNCAAVKSELEASHSNLVSVKSELETSHSKFSSVNDELDVLKKDKQELIYRQTVLDTEIVKAETQLELIKDVILREKAF